MVHCITPALCDDVHVLRHGGSCGETNSRTSLSKPKQFPFQGEIFSVRFPKRPERKGYSGKKMQVLQRIIEERLSCPLRGRERVGVVGSRLENDVRR